MKTLSEIERAKKRELYRIRKESGLCTMCGKPREATTIHLTRCEACRAMRRKGYIAKKDFEKYRLNKELEIYKKALELACKELDEHSKHPYCEVMPISNRGYEAIIEYYFDKARND